MTNDIDGINDDEDMHDMDEPSDSVDENSDDAVDNEFLDFTVAKSVHHSCAAINVYIDLPNIQYPNTCFKFCQSGDTVEFNDIQLKQVLSYLPDTVLFDLGVMRAIT